MGDLLKEICRTIEPGLPCSHPGFMGMDSICTRCGTSKPECGDPPTVPFSYIQPELSLTKHEITRLRTVNFWSLINRKKLHLVVDLDHTLLHSIPSHNLTLEQIHLLKTNPSANYNKGLLFEVCGGAAVVKLRPGAHEFLKQASAMFDLSVYTAGTREYAVEVARLLDHPVGGSLFGERRWRVMSREDCFPGKQKRLDVVLAHERVVLIVDDNEKVWGDCHKGNLIKISPYSFFVKNDSTIDSFNYELYGNSTELYLSRFKDDEMKERRELARVLRTLKEVHSVFYGDEFDVENGDVRKWLKRVQIGSVDMEINKEMKPKIKEKRKQQGEESLNKNIIDRAILWMIASKNRLICDRTRF